MAQLRTEPYDAVLLVHQPSELDAFAMVEQLKARLAHDASMLILVGETPALDGLVDAVGAADSNVLRQPLTSDQAAELAAGT